MTLTDMQIRQIINETSFTWHMLSEIPEEHMNKNELHHISLETTKAIENVFIAISELVIKCDNLHQISTLSAFIVRTLQERNNLRTLMNMEIPKSVLLGDCHNR